MFVNRPGISLVGGLLTIGNPSTFRRSFTVDPAVDLVTTTTPHGLLDGQYVQFTTTGTLPGGLMPDTRYYVRGVYPNVLRVSLTRGGPPVDILDAGTGEHVLIEEGVTRPEHQPRDIIVDRCYFTATPTDNIRRAIGIHGSNITVRNTFIEYAKDFNTDSQAIISYNGIGPYTLENNFLEGAAENVMFGGAIGREITNDPVDPNGVTPADILMRYNYLPKNAARFRMEGWKPGLWVEPGKAIRPASGANVSFIAMNSGYTGGVEPLWPGAKDETTTDGEVTWRAWSPNGALRWVVKNNFELKAAERAKIQYNVFDKMWTDAQRVAINLKTENQARPVGEYTARTENILFRDNIIRSAPSAMTFSRGVGGKASNWTIGNNLFYDIDAQKYGDGAERQFQFVNILFPGFVFEHNTVISTYSTATVLLDRTPAEPQQQQIVFRNNILARSHLQGVRGSGIAEGNPTFESYMCVGPCPEGTVSPNLIAGVNRNIYPPNTFNLCPTAAACAADLSGVKFTNPQDNDYSLSQESPFRGVASDGDDLGVNMRSLAQIRGLRAVATSTKAILYYQLSEPIQNIPCVVEAGRRPDFSDSVADVNPALFRRADSDRRATSVSDGAYHTFVIGSDVNEMGMDNASYSRALQPGTRYFFRLQCGGDTRTGEFTTTAGPTPTDVTVPVMIPAMDGAGEAVVEYGSIEEGAPGEFRHSTETSQCASGCEIAVPARTDSVLYFRVRYKTPDGDRLAAVQAIALQ
jgi:hypothetical protein